VRRNIQEMGGSIMIESVAGVGSTITLRLPLTLAILDGMSIRVNGEVYVLPLTCIIESLQAQPSQYKTLAKQGEVLQVRGQYLPLIRLADIFLTQTEHPTGSASLQQGLCMIVEAEKEMVALQVDELLGQQQVVIKNLETNYRRVSGISGATIMGDGRVALILDVPAVVRMAKNRSRA
ncbi:MAG: chemotaxis protein CheW, partial [Aquaspirillum sp.]|nr:chemotaxis protein CheW [Aquaspirillum sp.]